MATYLSEKARAMLGDAGVVECDDTFLLLPDSNITILLTNKQ
jgi:hypothetical protein